MTSNYFWMFRNALFMTSDLCYNWSNL